MPVGWQDAPGIVSLRAMAYLLSDGVPSEWPPTVSTMASVLRSRTGVINRRRSNLILKAGGGVAIVVVSPLERKG